jgi:hypothetical protein
VIEKATKVGRASCRRRDARQKEVLGNSQLTDLQNPEQAIEILIEGQECPFCHFAKLKRDGNEIVCPICGYGYKPCT